MIGYARVSTSDQDLSLQLDALTKAGCEKISRDEISGTIDNRPGLSEALSHLREGDTFVVWKLDRLGRGTKRLLGLTGDLQKRKVNFRSITESIDTTTPIGRFFFAMMAALAEMERDLLRERTMAGLEAAKVRGRVGGRKREMTAGKIESAKKLLKGGMPPREVATNLGVSVPTLYRWVPASELN